MAVATDAVPEAERSTTRWDSVRAALEPRLRAAARGPLLVYVAAHGLTMLVALAIVMHHHHGHGVVQALAQWDGTWYVKIAQHGYEHHMTLKADGTPPEMKIAFFPLLPWMMRALSAVLGTSAAVSGILISGVASLFAAVGIHALLKPYTDHRTALIVVALWGALPPSFSESMVYTESLFTALAAWALYALVRRRWLTAATLTAFAGLTRLPAFGLIGVVCLAAFLEFVRNRTAHRTWNWRAAAAVLIAPLGLVGYQLFLWQRIGRPNAWFLAEKAQGWRNSWDWGVSALRVFFHIATFDTQRDALVQAGGYMVTAVIVFVATALLFHLGDRRLPWTLIAWTTVGIVFTLMSGYYTSKARYLLPYFPVLVPLATAIRGARTRSLVVTIGVLAMVGGWYGSYFLNAMVAITPP